MNDGIIKGNGNSRYLKSVADFLTQYPTYEDFANALSDGTLPIDLNGINIDGWQQLGYPLNKATLLQDFTAVAYGLDNTAVPNDVFMLISKLLQRYQVTVKVLFDGNPYEGVTVSGITAYEGGSPKTNSDGIAVGYTSSKKGSVTVQQLFYDVPSKSVSFDMGSGVSTYVEMNLTSTMGIGDVITITSSKSIKFSSGVKFLDFFLVGGGGSGAVGSGNDPGAFGGGAGGKTNTVKNIENDGSNFTITIGSGATSVCGATGNSISGNTGGTTTVKKGYIQIASADGGGGGQFTSYEDGSPISSYAYGGKGGSGGGAARVYPYNIVQSGAVNGENSGDLLDNSGINYAGIGQGSTTKAFGDNSGIAYSAGGGSAARQNSINSNSAGNGKDGSGDLTSAGTNYGDAGGGVTTNNGTATSRGSSGVVMIRRSV